MPRERKPRQRKPRPSTPPEPPARSGALLGFSARLVQLPDGSHRLTIVRADRPNEPIVTVVPPPGKPSAPN